MVSLAPKKTSWIFLGLTTYLPSKLSDQHLTSALCQFDWAASAKYIAISLQTYSVTLSFELRARLDPTSLLSSAYHWEWSGIDSDSLLCACEIYALHSKRPRALFYICSSPDTIISLLSDTPDNSNSHLCSSPDTNVCSSPDTSSSYVYGSLDASTSHLCSSPDTSNSHVHDKSAALSRPVLCTRSDDTSTLSPSILCAKSDDSLCPIWL